MNLSLGKARKKLKLQSKRRQVKVKTDKDLEKGSKLGNMKKKW